MSDAINRKRMNIYRSATRLPVAVSGNHCQTVHIRVSIGCVSIFFFGHSIDASTRKRFACKVAERSSFKKRGNIEYNGTRGGKDDVAEG